tara:strand:+ start:926 stop:1396 length:471 start_codon:yes stop_codon:yes gene_type:complete
LRHKNPARLILQHPQPNFVTARPETRSAWIKMDDFPSPTTILTYCICIYKYIYFSHENSGLRLGCRELAEMRKARPVKHGLLKMEIESIFRNVPAVHPDPFQGEERLRAIGRNEDGRYIFAVFTLRQTKAGILIRPLSARYMHKKEIVSYEQQKGA